MADFDKIYLEYFSDVYKYVFTLCQNEVLAEEITQETFFKALRNINKFNGNCKLFVWLCQIAKNNYFSFIKKQKRLIPYPDKDYSDESPNMEDRFVDKEMIRKLHSALHKLNEPYKEVFTLRVFGELPFSQIGELFDKTESWARLIFYRAKIQLKEVIK